MKWTLPSLNLDKCTVENRGVSHNLRIEWQIVCILMRRCFTSHLIWPCTEPSSGSALFVHVFVLVCKAERVKLGFL